MQRACRARLDWAGPGQSTPTAAAKIWRGASAGAAVARHSVGGLRGLAACSAAVVALVAGAAPEPPGGPVRFLDHHGPVLHTVQLYLIYWGRGWTAPPASSPRADEITASVATLMAGSYLTGLAQYRGIGRGVLRGSAMITNSDPPDGFTDRQVGGFLDKQLDTGTVPAPDSANQTVYGVVVPTGVTAGGGSGFDGEHTYYTRRGRRIHYLWTAQSGQLESTTWILSHELVESVTDPEGSGFRGVAGACRQDGWCEIADICAAVGVLDGVTVWPYWSTEAGGCVIPEEPSSSRPARPPGTDAPSRSHDWPVRASQKSVADRP